MLRECAFGKYIPTNSVLHKVDPRIKIIFCFLYSLAVFFVGNLVSFCLLSIFVIYLMLLSKVKFKTYLENLKLIFPVLLLTCISNLIFASKEETFLKFFCFYLSKNNTINCLVIAFRMLFLVVVSSLVSFTTTPLDLTKALENLLKPLKYVKIPVEDVAMIITLTLRFVPLVIEQTNKVMDAQKMRGANFYSKNIIKKIKSHVYAVLPVLISLFKRIKDLATAMESRCYTGKNRTHFKELKFTLIDISAIFFLFIFFILVVLLKYFLK